MNVWSLLRLKLLRRSKRVKVCVYACMGCVLAGMMAVGACDLWVSAGTGALIYETVADCPQREVALVLGTAKYVGRAENTFYTPRIEMAAALYHAGKVRAVVVSGDNSRVGYDEPTQMKADIVALGVPAAHVTCDYAGLSTLDSVHRIQRVFQESRYIVVSQRFHVERALYIARTLHADEPRAVIACACPGPTGWRGAKVRLREVLARVKAVYENGVYVTDPTFLGAQEMVMKRRSYSVW